MPRKVNLRQIEAFKAVIESGTVVRAAELLGISQPALSKLISHLELDAGVRLFDRVKGRLAATDHAMRLYQEVDHIFAGVRQVENAVEAIRREEQGRLTVGVLPALSGTFLQRATIGFLKKNPSVFCSVQSYASQWIVDWLVARKLDVGLVGAGFDNPYLSIEPLMALPLVCIMPCDHPLTARQVIEPPDLHDTAFISLNQDTLFAQRIQNLLNSYGVTPNVVLMGNVMPSLAELVAGGLGVSLVHPLVVVGMQQRLAVRRFEPEIPHNFSLARSIDSRNARLADLFAEEARDIAVEMVKSMLAES